MSQIEKLVVKLKNNPIDTPHFKMHRILVYYGYKLQSIRGSHHKYGKDSAYPIIFPKHKNIVRKIYVKEIIEFLISGQYE